MMRQHAILCILFGMFCGALSNFASAQSLLAPREAAPAKEAASKDDIPTRQPTEEGPGSAEQSAHPLRFRRVTLPIAEILQRADKPVRYVPIDRNDFEQAINRLQVPQNAMRAEIGAQISAARYEAKLDDKNQWIGSAFWTVRHSAPVPVMLSLKPFGIAISDPRWTGDRADVPAKIGAGPAGDILLRAERSGELRFEWSLRGTMSDTGDVAYDFAVPEAQFNELVLQVPVDRTLVVQGAKLSVEDSIHEGMRAWHVLLRGNRPLKFTLLAAGHASRTQSLTVLQPSLRYDIKPSGLEVAADWRLDVLGEPLERLVVDFDAQLQLLQAQAAGEDLRFTVVDSPDQRRQAVVQLTRPLTGRDQHIRLIAVAPLKLDGIWSLPSIVASGVITQGAKPTLIVTAPLRLTEISLNNCRLASRQRSADLETETIALESFASNYQLDVRLVTGFDRLNFASASIIDAQPNQARMRYTCDITCRDGQQFQLDAQISPDWIIDSVASSPPEMLLDWELKRSAASGGRLVLHLAKPLKPNRSLRLNLAAERRKAPLQDVITAADFSLLTFPDIKPSRRLAVIHTDAAYRLDIQPRHALTRLNLAALDSRDAALLGLTERGFGFVLDERSDDLQIRLFPQKPDFTAEIDVQATVSQQGLREICTVACDPKSNEFDHLLVHFSQPRDQEPQWRLDADSAIASVRRLSSGEQQRLGLSESGETWRLGFRDAIDEPFVLNAQRTSPPTDHLEVSLTSLPEAESQRGNITVRSASDVEFALAQHQLRAVTPPLTETPGNRVLGSFAYVPSDVARSGLVLNQLRAGQHQSAWIWNCTGHTWLSLAGPIQHSARFWIESAGQTDFQLQLPDVVGEPRVLIDGEALDGVTFDPSKDQLTLPLLPDRRTCSMFIEWNTSHLSPSLWTNVSLQAPKTSIPVLAQRWTLWLPSDYELLNPPPKWRIATRNHVPWRERLFGSFARRPPDETFEPWLAHDWAMLGRQLTASDIALDVADVFFANLDRFDPSRNWGARIANAWGDASPDSNRALFVHLTMLAPMGIQPNATAKSTGSAYKSSTHELVLLVHPAVSLLTTRRWAADHIDSSIASSRNRAFSLSDTLAEELTTGENRTMSIGEVLSLEAWLSSSTDGSPIPNSLPDNDVVPFGWTPYTFELSHSEPMQVIAIRRTFVSAVGYAAALIAAALAWKLATRRPLVGLVFVGTAAIFALLVPATLTPLGSGIFLGLLAGFAAHWIVKCARPNSVPPPTDRLKDELARTMPVATVLLALLIVPNIRAIARDVGDDPNKVIFDVLIPSETESEPTSNYVYVPEPLYQALIRHASDISTARDQWLITQARYESPTPDKAVANGAVWTAHYIVESFDNARVHLPLGSSGAHLVPQGATLDDKPLQFDWDGRLKVMLFDLPRAGKHKLEVEFIPTPRGGDTPRFEFTIPSVPDSRLILHSLPAIPRPELSGYGMIGSNNDDSLRCDLGPVGDITLQKSRAAAEPAPPQFAATEMFWLRAAPGALTLEARFQLKVERGEVDHVFLQLDPSTHVIPPDENSAIAAVKWLDDGRKLRLDFREPTEESTVFDLSFVLEPRPLPDRLVWPRIALVGAKQTRRILATSSTPNVQLETFPIPGAKILSPAEFALLWPSLSVRPRWVAEVPATPGDWEIQIAPRPSTISSAIQTHVSARRTHVDLKWLADIQIAGEPRLDFKILAPVALSIADIEVSDAANLRPSRWVRSDSGIITVVLDSPLVGEAQIRLTGSVPLDSASGAAIPNLEIEEAAAEHQIFFVTRAINTSVTLDDSARLQQLSTDEAARRWSDVRSQFPPDNHDHLVAAFTQSARGASLNLRVTPNRPQTDVLQVTTIERSDGGWTATLDAEITTSSGALDELRLGLPSNWPGPFSIEPSMQSQIIDSPDGVRVLVIHPPAPLAAHSRIRIRGALVSTSNQPLRAPEIHIDGAKTTRDYLILPVQHNLQQLAWDIRDLVEEPLPKSFNQLAVQTGVKTFLRASTGAAAELKSIEKLAENPQVRLVDVALAWEADRSCYGVASFDLEPAGAESCLLGLPADFELVHVAIDGIPHLPQAVASQRWRLWLGRARLPLRVEVLFSGALPDNSRDAPSEALAPWLVGLPVDKTLWTISGPDWSGLPNINLQESLRPAAAGTTRLKSTGLLIQTAAATFVDASADEVTRWYRPWLDRWRQARDSLQRMAAISMADDAVDTTGETLSHAEAEQVQLARRLGVWPAVEPIWNEPSPQDSPLRTWHQSLGRHNPSAYYVLDGAAAAPSLDYPKAFAGDWATRVGQSAVACVIVLIIGWAFRATRLVDAFARWPQAVVIALGLLWWLLLSPSVVGWIIVALGAFGPRIDRAIGKLVRHHAPVPGPNAR